MRWAFWRRAPKEDRDEDKADFARRVRELV